MDDRKRKPLGEWDRVVPDTQPSLFPVPFNDALAELGITRAQVGAWWSRGWLSMAESPTIDQPAWNELVILRDMELKGLGFPVINHLLEQLPRPLAIDPNRLAYSFAVGWVMRPEPCEPRIEDLDADLVREWVDSVPDDELDTLWALLDSITERLREATRDP